MTYDQEQFEREFRGLFEDVFGGENFERMRQSRWFLAMMHKTNVDPLLALQIGTALLMNKPLVIVAYGDMCIDPRLCQVADGIVRVSSLHPGPEEKLRMQQALVEILNRPREKQSMSCFRCDGTGLICDICGESESACTCEKEGKEPTYSECEDCEGTGK